MRQIRTCDFCGADATGVYEPLPEEFGANGPRILLCTACRDRLASVLDPLLDRLDAEGLDADRSSAEADRTTSDTDRVTADADSAGGDQTDLADDGAASDENTERASDSNPERASGSSPDPGPGGDSEAGGRPVTERRGTPRGYRKVLRFLENRELPIDREEAERLAADAYDLDPETASAAIDHAVQYGRLRDVGGELRG